MHALVIDDDEQWGRVVATYVQLAGAQATVALTLTDGITLATAQHFDVLFLDLTLPDATPDDSFAAIKPMKAMGVLRVAVLTGACLTGELRQQAKDSGADALVNKGDWALVKACVFDVLAGHPTGC